jgi:hypothetical protein
MMENGSEYAAAGLGCLLMQIPVLMQAWGQYHSCPWSRNVALTSSGKQCKERHLSKTSLEDLGTVWQLSSLALGWDNPIHTMQSTPCIVCMKVDG